jgi:hypothetical protein
VWASNSTGSGKPGEVGCSSAKGHSPHRCFFLYGPSIDGLLPTTTTKQQQQSSALPDPKDSVNLFLMN